MTDLFAKMNNTSLAIVSVQLHYQGIINILNADKNTHLILNEKNNKENTEIKKNTARVNRSKCN